MQLKRELSSSFLAGEAKGKIEGKIEGEIKTIRILQDILRIPVDDEKQLQQRTLVELQKQTSELRAKVQDRGTIA